MHAPSTINKLELAIGNDPPRLIPLSFRLFTPPARKEADFNIDEFSVRVLQESRENGVNDVVNVPVEVLIHRYLPTCVIVRVRD